MILIKANITIVPTTKESGILRSALVKTGSHHGEKLDESNISSGIGNVTNNLVSGGRPFYLGVSKLGSGDTFESKVPYFVGGVFSSAYSSEVGKDVYAFPERQVIHFSNQIGLRAINIVFDDFNDGHPTEVIVNVFYIDSGTYEEFRQPVSTSSVLVDLGNEYEDGIILSVGIENWNKAERPLVIQGIVGEIVIPIDFDTLMAIERNIGNKKGTSQLEYGILSTTAIIEFLTTNYDFEAYSRNGLLGASNKLEIFVKNAANQGDGEKIGEYRGAEWSLDIANNSASVKFNDKLLLWQKLPARASEFALVEGIPLVFFERLCTMYGLTPDDFAISVGAEVRLRNAAMENGVLSDRIRNITSQWGAFDSFCKAFGFYMYVNEVGKIALEV